VSADGAAVELSEWAGFQRAMHLSEMLAGQHNAPAALSDAYLPAPGAVAAAALGLLGECVIPWHMHRLFKAGCTSKARSGLSDVHRHPNAPSSLRVNQLCCM